MKKSDNAINTTEAVNTTVGANMNTTSEYIQTPTKKSGGAARVIIIILISVLAIGLSALLVYQVMSKQSEPQVIYVDVPVKTQSDDVPSYNPGSLIINKDPNSEGKVDFKQDDTDRMFIDIAKFFDYVGAEIITDSGNENLITVYTPVQITKFTLNSAEVEVTNKETNITDKRQLTVPLTKEGTKTYLYIRDLILIFSNTDVVYDEDADVTHIRFETVQNSESESADSSENDDELKEA